MPRGKKKATVPTEPSKDVIQAQDAISPADLPAQPKDLTPEQSAQLMDEAMAQFESALAHNPEPDMPEDFEDNQSEAEAVEAREWAEGDELPTDEVPDPVMFMVSAQRLLAAGVLPGDAVRIMTISDDQAQYQVVSDWSMGEIIIEDMGAETRRYQINHEWQHAAQQHNHFKTTLSVHQNSEQGYKDQLAAKKAHHEQMAVLIDPHWVESMEMNIAQAQAEQEKIAPLVKEWAKRMDEAKGKLDKLPPRRRWRCAVTGPRDITAYELSGNQQN